MLGSRVPIPPFRQVRAVFDDETITVYPLPDDVARIIGATPISTRAEAGA